MKRAPDHEEPVVSILDDAGSHQLPPARASGRWTSSPRLRALVTLCSVVVAIGVFVPAFDLIRGGAFALVFLPVIVAGVSVGVLGGTVTAMAMAAFTGVVSWSIGNSVWQSIGAASMAALPLGLLGVGLGRYRDLMVALGQTNAELRREIAERKRLEEERRRMEAGLRESHKLEALGHLAGGIAHDFNNLLTGVLGNAGLLLEDLDDDAPTRQSAREIQEAARRAAVLAKQMLAYSGRGRFLLEPIELSDLVREIEPLMVASVSDSTTLDCQLGEDLPAVQGDRAQLGQVVLDLVLNASESLPGGEGEVRVRTGVATLDDDAIDALRSTIQLQPGDYVWIEIQDTGCGMDAETRERMFDPFFTTKFQGRGLGLAAVLGIVRGHHGAIRVDTEVGSGTSVGVFLPVSDDSPLRAVRRTEPDPPPRTAGTVLVVDDEDVVRRFLRRALERAGHTVVLAANGEEAVEVFQERASEIDLVILDLTMPVMGGDQALVALRGIRADTRILLASGYTADEVSADLRREADGFVAKPFQLGDLLEVVADALSSR